MFSIATHNGKITVFNPRTNNQRTFMIKTQKKDAKFAPSARIVYLLIGPNNESDYLPFGFINGGKITLWKRYKTKQYEMLCKVLEDTNIFPFMEYHYEGKCRVCNKTLTTKTSIFSGIGPVCLNKGY